MNRDFLSRSNGIPHHREIPFQIPDATAEEIRTGHPELTDQIISPVLRSLKRAYSSTGSPHVVLASSLDVVRAPAFLSRVNRGSVELAKFHAFVADLHLATGPRGAIPAMRHAECALEEIEHIAIVTGRARQVFVDSTLIWAVAHKILGSFDDSHRILRKAIGTVQERFGGNALEVIPLVRQELMMQQTVRSHEQLAAAASRYATTRPREYYGTVKRVFEFLLNNGRLRDAERLLPEFRRAFRHVADQLSPVSLVSFQKNIGQYYLSAGQSQHGTHVLVQAYAHARTLGLGGQALQIGILLEGVYGGDAGVRLVTASMEMDHPGAR